MIKSKSPFLALGLLFALSSHAQVGVRVCGQYQWYELPNNSHWAAIVDYKAYRTGVTYAISNPADPVVKTMVKGYCYCVTGQIGADSDSSEALSHSLLITEIDGRPYFSCR